MEEHPRNWIQKNYTSFNGIRGLAVSMVFFSHFGMMGSYHLHKGITWAGVDLFFVMSGFLITGILWKTKESPAYFRDFYVRRSLRILPVYWGLLLAILSWGAVQHLHLLRRMVPDFFFVQNLMQRGVALGTVRPSPIWLPFLRHSNAVIDLGALWSLCVEEQFYLLWPFVVRVVSRRAVLLRIALGGIVCVLGIRSLLYRLDSGALSLTNYTYFQPYCRFDSLLFGAALNLWLQRRKLTRAALRRLSTAVFLASACTLLIAMLVLGGAGAMDETNPVIQTFGLTLVGLACAAVLLRSLDESSRIARVFRAKPLEQLGQVSYGFYVYHVLFNTEIREVVTRMHQPFRLVMLLVIFGLTYALAAASYRFYESPFLRLKERFAPGHRSVPAGTLAPSAR